MLRASGATRQRGPGLNGNRWSLDQLRTGLVERAKPGLGLGARCAVFGVRCSVLGVWSRSPSPVPRPPQSMVRRSNLSDEDRREQCKDKRLNECNQYLE